MIVKLIGKIFHLIFVLLILALIIGIPANWMIHRSYSDPEVHYFYNAEKEGESGKESLRFVMISDLYDYVFEGGNGVVSELAGDTSPDAILIGGNMITSDTKDLTPVTDLIKSLVLTAPVYYAYGEQEVSYVSKHLNAASDSTGDAADPLREELEKAGAVVLNDEYTDVVLYGINARIGNINEKAYELTNADGRVKRKYEEAYKLLSDFQNTDSFKVMISSKPENFIYADACSAWDIDLVACAGGLGGLAVLPHYGGVFGGSNNYFPEYVHGMYEKDGVDLFITSGLSAPEGKIPRFNNPPEIAVLDIKGLENVTQEEKKTEEAKKEEKETDKKNEKKAEEKKTEDSGD